ncbi:uncharacterized protein B0I36DRAFT_355537 [Microdochium trichocladiopsis]|uniref:Uncharacterized protein n=1 Tax=Microdochium trichocladiopsis TaxID=1682393 RepID=A0A9P9BLP1_9PEZI|nr:uncharacterized protein B0I36DRAFT_355537 [Microdochium trichocladiopsis]KAH7014297.1 hypothetical protein B0I36DRAFT_355537 [Microdochium trichocladiopsis]
MKTSMSQNRQKCEVIATTIDEHIAALQALRNKFVLLRASTAISDFIQEATEGLARLGTEPANSMPTQAAAQEMFIGHPHTQRHIRMRHEHHFVRESEKLVDLLVGFLGECQQVRGGEAGTWQFVPGPSISANSSLREDKGKQPVAERSAAQAPKQTAMSSEPSRAAGLAKTIDEAEIKAMGRITLGDWIDASMAGLDESLGTTPLAGDGEDVEIMDTEV